jgi:hypothetical protein
LSTYEVFSGTYINISNDNILQIQIIWTTTIGKIEDNITGQKQFYWLEYKSQFCIILIIKHKYGGLYTCTRSLSSDEYIFNIEIYWTNLLELRMYFWTSKDSLQNIPIPWHEKYGFWYRYRKYIIIIWKCLFWKRQKL